MNDESVLPAVEPLDLASLTVEKRRILVTAEGFEERSLSFLSQSSNICFEKVIICKYHPPKKSKFKNLYNMILDKCSKDSVHEIVFNRLEPFPFEVEMEQHFAELYTVEEVILDISVMSKYMIMQIVCLLREYTGDLRIIYTEPLQYAPFDEEWLNHEQENATLLPSVGVQNIVRTPLLSSLIMQKSPSIMVAFLSFNEQLIRALLSECNPARLLLLNGVPPHLLWREKSMNDIHRGIIQEYISDNPVDETGLLKRKCNTLYYGEAFLELVNIYKFYCEDYRIILSPTGSKMQTVGCALIKSCCEDIHVEYPTPESYYVDGYSSSDIREIHQIFFHDVKRTILEISHKYELNG